MSALPGDPEATSVALKPFANESMATNTPTVPAMPSTATIVEVQRALMLLKLYEIGTDPRKGASNPAIRPARISSTKIAASVRINPKRSLAAIPDIFRLSAARSRFANAWRPNQAKDRWPNQQRGQ